MGEERQGGVPTEVGERKFSLERRNRAWKCRLGEGKRKAGFGEGAPKHN